MPLVRTIEKGANAVQSEKDYLGDSVYVEWKNGMLLLTTDNGMGPSNSIWLEPETYKALVRFVGRVQRIIDEQE